MRTACIHCLNASQYGARCVSRSGNSMHSTTSSAVLPVDSCAEHTAGSAAWLSMVFDSTQTAKHETRSVLRLVRPVNAASCRTALQLATPCS